MSPIADIIAHDPVGMKQLRAARALQLPDWCIAAGFVRNRVWDHLHGVSPGRPPADIDVIYFDPANTSKESELAFEARLDRLLPDLPWQVRNQARMHVWKGLPPHTSTSDAMVHWLETVTVIGVRLEEDDSLTVVAPLGTGDLLELRCRPTAFGRTRLHEYEARIAAKRCASCGRGCASSIESGNLHQSSATPTPLEKTTILQARTNCSGRRCPYSMLSSRAQRGTYTDPQRSLAALGMTAVA